MCELYALLDHLDYEQFDIWLFKIWRQSCFEGVNKNNVHPQNAGFNTKNNEKMVDKHNKLIVIQT